MDDLFWGIGAYCVLMVLYAIFTGLIVDEEYNNPKLAARLVLTSPFWPFVVTGILLYQAQKGIRYLVRTAELIPQKKPNYSKISQMEKQIELEDSIRDYQIETQRAYTKIEELRAYVQTLENSRKKSRWSR